MAIGDRITMPDGYVWIDDRETVSVHAGRSGVHWQAECSCGDRIDAPDKAYAMQIAEVHQHVHTPTARILEEIEIPSLDDAAAVGA